MLTDVNWTHSWLIASAASTLPGIIRRKSLLLIVNEMDYNPRERS